MAAHSAEVERAAVNVDAARRRLERTREELRHHRQEFNQALRNLEHSIAEERRRRAGRRA